jgi:hypothetical protein
VTRLMTATLARGGTVGFGSRMWFAHRAMEDSSGARQGPLPGVPRSRARVGLGSCMI